MALTIIVITMATSDDDERLNELASVSQNITASSSSGRMDERAAEKHATVPDHFGKGLRFSARDELGNHDLDFIFSAKTGYTTSGSTPTEPRLPKRQVVAIASGWSRGKAHHRVGDRLRVIWASVTLAAAIEERPQRSLPAIARYGNYRDGISARS